MLDKYYRTQSENIMKKRNIFTLGSAILLSLSTSPLLANTTTLEERTISLPSGVSPEFKTILRERSIPEPIQVPTNQEDWLSLQSTFNVAGAQKALDRLDVTYEKKSIAGVDTFFVTPNEVALKYTDKWLIHIHGGSFVFGGGKSALREAIWVANGLGARVISIDYRKPPLHQFPSAIDDIVAVWKQIIKTQNPESTAMFGTSAGGNLTLATTLKLEQLNLPAPGALFVGTPAVDLKEASDSWSTLQGLDPLGQRQGLIEGTFDIYVGEQPRDNPLISPIYADIKSFPPTIFISGTRDLLLSDTVRMHRLLRSANVDTDLHIYDGQSHGDYLNGILVEVQS